MEPIVYAFVRFFKEESHREDFLRGDLFMNRLKYFKQYEEADKCNIGDLHEGLSGWLQPNDVKMKIEDVKTGKITHIEGFAAPVRIGYNHHDEYHVYCMSALYCNDEAKFESIEALRSEVMLSVDKGDLGDFCSVIFRPDQFVERLDKVLFSDVEANGCAGHGVVEYYDPDTFSGIFDGDDAIMRKKSCFSHQREFRIFAWNGSRGKETRTINIGDLSDIVFNCHKNEFNKFVSLG